MPNPGEILIKNYGNATSDQHPVLVVTADPGYKMINCGYLVTTDDPNTNAFITACYPNSIFQWTLAAKDEGVESSSKITAFTVQLFDPNDDFDVQIFSCTSTVGNHNATTATVASGYTCAGGGAQANWTVNGQYLTTSAPNASNGWNAVSQDHLEAELGSVTAYAVGVKPRAPQSIFNVNLNVDSSLASSEPDEDVAVASGDTLIGGGASISQRSFGNMLVASYPNGTEWYARGHDNLEVDAETIDVYSIGATISVA